MPMRSKAQNRWMWANHPAMAKEWAEHTPDFSKLPEKVRPKKKPAKKKASHALDVLLSTSLSKAAEEQRQGPPNYGPAPAPAQGCAACKNYQQGVCAKYGVAVDQDATCDAFDPVMKDVTVPPAPTPIPVSGSTLDMNALAPPQTTGIGLGTLLGKAAADDPDVYIRWANAERSTPSPGAGSAKPVWPMGVYPARDPLARWVEGGTYPDTGFWPGKVSPPPADRRLPHKNEAFVNGERVSRFENFGDRSEDVPLGSAKAMITYWDDVSDLAEAVGMPAGTERMKWPGMLRMTGQLLATPKSGPEPSPGDAKGPGFDDPNEYVRLQDKTIPPDGTKVVSKPGPVSESVPPVDPSWLERNKYPLLAGAGLLGAGLGGYGLYRYLNPPDEENETKGGLGAELGKSAGVLAHVAGPSGSGKTTLLNRLAASHPGLLAKDLDEFDDDAVNALGYAQTPKSVYTDDMLAALAQKRQSLMDDYLAANAGKPVVFGGHHWEGTHTLNVPADNKLLLNTHPLVAAWRAYRRSRSEPPQYRRRLTEIPSDYAEAKSDRQRLLAEGYEPMSHDKITASIGNILGAEANGMKKLSSLPRIAIDRPKGFRKSFYTQKGPLELPYPVDYGYFEDVINPEDDEPADVFVGTGTRSGRFMKGNDTTGVWQPDERKWYHNLSDQEYDAVMKFWSDQHPTLIRNHHEFASPEELLNDLNSLGAEKVTKLANTQNNTPAPILPSVAQHNPTQPPGPLPSVLPPRYPVDPEAQKRQQAGQQTAQRQTPQPDFSTHTQNKAMAKAWTTGYKSRLLAQSQGRPLPNIVREREEPVPPHKEAGHRDATRAVEALFGPPHVEDAQPEVPAHHPKVESKTASSGEPPHAPVSVADNDSIGTNIRILAGEKSPTACGFLKACEDAGVGPYESRRLLKEAADRDPLLAAEVDALSALVKEAFGAQLLNLGKGLAQYGGRLFSRAPAPAAALPKALPVAKFAPTPVNPSLIPQPLRAAKLPPTPAGAQVGGAPVTPGPGSNASLVDSLIAKAKPPAPAVQPAGGLTSTPELSSVLGGKTQNIRAPQAPVSAPRQSAAAGQAATEPYIPKPAPAAPKPATGGRSGSNPAIPPGPPNPPYNPAGAAQTIPASQIPTQAAGAASKPPASWWSRLNNSPQAAWDATRPYAKGVVNAPNWLGGKIEAFSPGQLMARGAESFLGTSGPTRLGNAAAKLVDVPFNLITGKGALQNTLQSGKRLKGLGYGTAGVALPYLGGAARGEAVTDPINPMTAVNLFGAQPFFQATNALGLTTPDKARNASPWASWAANAKDLADIGGSIPEAMRDDATAARVTFGARNVGSALGDAGQLIGGALPLQTASKEIDGIDKQVGELQRAGGPDAQAAIAALQKKRQELADSLTSGKRETWQDAKATADRIKANPKGVSPRNLLWAQQFDLKHPPPQPPGGMTLPTDDLRQAAQQPAAPGQPTQPTPAASLPAPSAGSAPPAAEETPFPQPTYGQMAGTGADVAGVFLNNLYGRFQQMAPEHQLLTLLGLGGILGGGDMALSGHGGGMGPLLAALGLAAGGYGLSQGQPRNLLTPEFWNNFSAPTQSDQPVMQLPTDDLPQQPAPAPGATPAAAPPVVPEDGPVWDPSFQGLTQLRYHPEVQNGLQSLREAMQKNDPYAYRDSLADFFLKYPQIYRGILSKSQGALSMAQAQSAGMALGLGPNGLTPLVGQMGKIQDAMRARKQLRQPTG